MRNVYTYSHQGTDYVRLSATGMAYVFDAQSRTASKLKQESTLSGSQPHYIYNVPDRSSYKIHTTTIT